MTRNLIYSSVSAGSAVLMLALLAVAGQYLGVADYGDFMYAVKIATIAEVFMDFGLHQVTIRAIARDRQRAGGLFHTSLLLKILPGVVMVAASTAVVFWLRPEPAVRVACVLMLLSAVPRSYLLTARGVLQGLERFGHDAFVTTLDRALLLAACVVALWMGASVIQLAVVFLLVRFGTAAFALRVIRGHVGPGRFDPTLWRPLTLEALPIGFFLLALNLYSGVDTLMLGSMAGPYATGLYNAAYPIYEGLTYATAIISAVLAPRLSRLWTTDAAAYRRLALRSAAAVAVLAVGIAAVAWPLAAWALVLFGEGFAPAAGTLRWLLAGLPFIYVIWVLHSVAISSENTRVLLWVTLTGVLLNVGLNLWLIPRYAQDGAAAATVASEVMTVLLLFYGLRSALAGRRPISGDPAA
jgi:O-antigen/teichoic acid export membrane protein